MPIDAYAPCPCGSGKKVKFCCSDLIDELEKIQKMIDADQTAACLEFIRQQVAKHHGRASLLALQAMIEGQRGLLDEATETLGLLLKDQPGNPVGLAELAIIQARKQDAVVAVETLQDALENTDDQMPQRVYEAIGAVGQTLLSEGDIFAARAHLMMQASIGREDDTRALALVMRLNSTPQIPLLLKDDPSLELAVGDGPWRQAFDDAYEAGTRGRWRLAAVRFASLADQDDVPPIVHRNLAYCRGWLSDEEDLLSGLRKFVATTESWDDAVEAEALAQLLDPQSRSDKVDVVRRSLEIQDYEILATALTADARASQMPVDPNQAADDAPLPKSIFWVLDRPLPESAEGLTSTTVPNVLGVASLFGRETDREARLELVAHAGDEIDSAAATIAEIGGDALSQQGADDVVTQVTRSEVVLSWSWRMPANVTNEDRLRLVAERRQQAIYQDWPQAELAALGGKAPAKAADDKQGQVAVAAAILLLEVGSSSENEGIDYNQLRTQLGVPTAERVNPADVNLESISLVRLARIDAEKLTNEDLVQQYRRAGMVGAANALEALASEVIARDDLAEIVDQAEAYGLLAELQHDPQQSLTYLEQARTIDEEQGRSSATWDLAELSVHIQTGNTLAAQKMLEHIRTDHMNEPGVAQRLMEMLMAAGVISPDGSPAGPAPGDAAVPATTPVDKELWTPDSATGGSEQKSKLWVPE